MCIYIYTYLVGGFYGSPTETPKVSPGPNHNSFHQKTKHQTNNPKKTPLLQPAPFRRLLCSVLEASKGSDGRRIDLARAACWWIDTHKEIYVLLSHAMMWKNSKGEVHVFALPLGLLMFQKTYHELKPSGFSKWDLFSSLGPCKVHTVDIHRSHLLPYWPGHAGHHYAADVLVPNHTRGLPV